MEWDGGGGGEVGCVNLLGRIWTWIKQMQNIRLQYSACALEAHIVLNVKTQYHNLFEGVGAN